MSHAPSLNPDYVDDAGRPIFHPVEEPHHPEGHSTMLGFWIYLMSDCLIFAILFAAYAVLGGNLLAFGHLAGILYRYVRFARNKGAFESLEN